MPNKNGKSRNKRTNRSRKAGGSAAGGSRIINLGMAGSSADDHLISADINYKPPSGTYSSTPPKNINNQVHFFRQSLTTTVTTNTVTVTENNLTWNAATNLGHSGSFLAIFDQYYLDSVVVTISNLSSNAGVSSLPQVYTALDFDSAGAIGLTGIQNFSTCNVSVLGPGKSVTRVVRPSIAGNSQGFNASTVNRTWVDSAFVNVTFFGLRIIINNTPAAALILDISYDCIWAFRNNI